MNRLPAHAAFWLTVARIYLGAYWLLTGLGKLIGGRTIAIPPWYHGPLAHTVLINAHTAVPIVAALEVLTGILLIFGLFIRVGALGAFLLAAGFFLTKGGYSSYASVLGSSATLMVLALVTFMLAADFGVDGVRRAVRERHAVRATEHLEATPVDIQWPE
ncbi:MAG: DoxX family membrane protein [Candidatus Eremiobacteraeota bacterium]|nr:DoxX family membrane protein [Candidatus Eremiobacteraeota bacterium]